MQRSGAVSPNLENCSWCLTFASPIYGAKIPDFVDNVVVVQINESWIILRFNDLFVTLHVGRVALHRIELCLLQGWFCGTHAIRNHFDAGAYWRARLAAHQAGQARRETIVIGQHLETDVNNDRRKFAGDLAFTVSV